MKSGIYIILNLENQNIYVGSAVVIRKRWWEHRTALRCGGHDNSHLQRAWNKYGENAFEFKVWIFCEPVILLHYEQMKIDSFEWDMLYNISPTAGSTLGQKNGPLSPEQRADISALHKGNKYNLGKKHTPEHRAKNSKANKGRKLSSETRAKMKGNQNAKGYEHSPNTRAKMSRDRKNRKSNKRGH